MSRYHSFYDFLYKVLPSEMDILFMDLPGNSRYQGFFGYFLSFINHLYIFIRIATCKHRIIFLREYNNYGFVFLLLSGFIFRKKILFNVNHNIKSLLQHKKKERLCKFFNAELVIFEHIKYPENSPRWFFPFNSIKTNQKIHKKDEAINIGVVGSSRSEKQADKLLELLVSQKKNGAFKNSKFWLGSSIDTRSSQDQKENIIFFDTSLNKSYHELLKKLDIVVINYSSDYFFRTSGVIADAIQNGCAVIAPNYELIRNQIQWPVSVGLNYDNEFDFIKKLLELEEFYKNGGKFDFKTYFETRSVDKLKTSINYYNDSQ